MWRRQPILCVLAALSLLLFAAVAAVWSLARPHDGTPIPIDRITVHTLDNDLFVHWPDPDSMWWDTPKSEQYVFLGMGVRVLEWDDGSRDWLLRIPMIPLLLLTAILPAAWLVRWLRLRRQLARTGICRQCGYDLRGSGGDCPECGAKRAVQIARGD